MDIEPLYKHKAKLNNVHKSKIIERIHRVTSNKKEKNIKSNEDNINIDIDNVNNISFNKKDNNNKNNNINKVSNIKKNILEIVKSNNLSDIIISPNSKKISKVFLKNKSK